MMRALMLMLLMGAPVAAEAGTRAVYEQDDGEQLVFEVGDDGRFRAGGDRHYRIVREDGVYQVAERDGEVRVARIEDLAAAFAETMPALLRAGLKGATFLAEGEPQHWERRGRATINGWRGREYKLIESHFGAPGEFDPFEDMEATAVVVSEDPALEPLGDAVLHYTADELYLKRHFVSGVSADAVLRSLDGLAQLGTVIASSENGIRLKSVEEAEVSPERLELPAEPLSKSEIVALIRAKQSPFRR